MNTASFSGKTMDVSYVGGDRHLFRPIHAIIRSGNTSISPGAKDTITVFDEFKGTHDFKVGVSRDGSGTLFPDLSTMEAFIVSSVQAANA